jgi:hypothetical protein
LRDLNRPRVVAIIKPQINERTIRLLLPILFASESQFTVTEKIGRSFTTKNARFMREESSQSIYYGDNPWLYARRVTGLYAKSYDNTVYRQTLHWTEEPHYVEDAKTFQIVQSRPPSTHAEDVHFDVLWFGESFLE